MKNIILKNYLDVIQTDEPIQEIISLATAATAISATYMASMIIKMAAGVLGETMTKAGKECGSLKGVAKNLCIIKMKIGATENQVKIMRSKMSMCNKTRDPRACREKIQNKYNEVRKKLKRFKSQESIYMQKQRVESEKSKESMQV